MHVFDLYFQAKRFLEGGLYKYATGSIYDSKTGPFAHSPFLYIVSLVLLICVGLLKVSSTNFQKLQNLNLDFNIGGQTYSLSERPLSTVSRYGPGR
jgi:hypothetical protein